MNELILNYIKKKIGKNNPFSPQNLLGTGLKISEIRQSLNSLVKSKNLKHLGYGTYVLNAGSYTYETAISERYILAAGNNIGFYAGKNFKNSLLDMDPDFKEQIDIYTNKATSGKKTIYSFERRITIRKPYLPITNDNLAINLLLTYLTANDDTTIKENLPILQSFCRRKHLTADEAMKYGKFFPAKATKRLFLYDIYRSLWKH